MFQTIVDTKKRKKKKKSCAAHWLRIGLAINVLLCDL